MREQTPTWNMVVATDPSPHRNIDLPRVTRSLPTTCTLALLADRLPEGLQHGWPAPLLLSLAFYIRDLSLLLFPLRGRGADSGWGRSCENPGVFRQWIDDVPHSRVADMLSVRIYGLETERGLVFSPQVVAVVPGKNGIT